MKGKVKRIQVEMRAALGRTCHYRLMDMGYVFVGGLSRQFICTSGTAGWLFRSVGVS